MWVALNHLRKAITQGRVEWDRMREELHLVPSSAGGLSRVIRDLVFGSSFALDLYNEVERASLFRDYTQSVSARIGADFRPLYPDIRGFYEATDKRESSGSESSGSIVITIDSNSTKSVESTMD
jgi:hypothetical protein